MFPLYTVATNSFGLKANLSELKVGFEGSTAVKWDNNTETTYTNVSVSGWAIAAAYVFITTGQSMPSPLYAYEYEKGKICYLQQ
jgi:hypothetical protein